MEENKLFSRHKLISLIWPLIVEQILAVTVGMADVIMVSSAGEAAVSGVSLVDMINVLVLNIFAALATGGAVVTSQLLGGQETKKACNSAKHLLIITLFLALSVMIIVLPLREPLLRVLFGSIDDAVLGNALTYFWISALSYPFIALYNSGAALFRSMGNSKISMLTSVGMNLMNIAGNAIFVFVLNMGVAGVALSSLLSRMMAAVVMLLLLRAKNQPISITYLERFRINPAQIRRILRIGVPNALENSLFQLGRVLVVSIISVFGTVQIAANAVANNLDALGCIPGQAMSLAMITVVGHCVGAHDGEQVRYYTKKLMKYTYIIMASLNAVILLTLPWSLKLYQLSPETLKLATILVFIHDGCAMLLWPSSFTLPNALRACNDVKFTMIASIASMWVFRIVFGFIFGKVFSMGAIGVWIAMVMDWAFRAGCFILRFWRGRWQKFAFPGDFKNEIQVASE